MSASNGTWKFVVWERLNKSGKWCPYSAEISKFLETCFKKDLDNASLGDVEDALKIYSVNIKDLIQTSEKTGTKSKVRRQLYSNIDSLNKGFIWQWNGNNNDIWHSYDIDVSDFIESDFLKGKKSTLLKKNFKGYNYEIDFTKMSQINKQTKRKRPIRRKQNVSSYPVEHCPDTSTSHEPKNTATEVHEIDKQYPALTQEIPGSSALINQAQNYLRSVTTLNTGEIPTAPPLTVLNSDEHVSNHENFKDNSSVNTIPSNSTSSTTYAIVNGSSWYDSRPPHTSPSKLKPVPGIEPLPKVKAVKKSAKKKKSLPESDNVLELHTDELPISDPSYENICNDMCIICYEALTKESSYNGDRTILKLKLCSHIFHRACLEAMYNSGPKDRFLQCPTCKKIHGEKCGTQPPGEMIYHVLPYSLPSFPEHDTIQIIYNFHSGTQGPEHPRPGKKYTARGFPRHCYLPDNEMGRKVLRLLTKAWKRRLIFTIGTSSTTGEENTVTWNEIHHKTEFGCNRRGHGYPDPNYFDNVLAELEAHGVKDDDVYLWQTV